MQRRMLGNSSSTKPALTPIEETAVDKYKEEDDCPEIVKQSFHLQRWLSRGQRYCLIGVIPSILKIPLGAPQLLAALFVWIVMMPVAGLCSLCARERPPVPEGQLTPCLYWHTTALMLLFMGGAGIGYAVANMCTLSCIGWWCETCAREWNKTSRVARV